MGGNFEYPHVAYIEEEKKVEYIKEKKIKGMYDLDNDFIENYNDNSIIINISPCFNIGDVVLLRLYCTYSDGEESILSYSYTIEDGQITRTDESLDMDYRPEEGDNAYFWATNQGERDITINKIVLINETKGITYNQR